MSTIPILAYTVDEACSVASIGKTAIYQAIGTGELVARKYGRKTLILAADLHRWIEGLPTVVPKPIDQTKKKPRYHSRNVTETNLISSAEPAFQPMK